MSAIEIADLVKRFGPTHAVGPVSLSVAAGELVALLGPSGCGKTTTLRMIAGFEEPTGGTIRLGGQVANDLPIERRGVGMVFQSYALFPHLSVYENVAFGLRLRRVAAPEIAARVAEALTLVGLDGYGERMPRQLSGGQQQRVSLARSLAVRPAVLLLDEPLSNLDLKLREQMRDEIRRLQKQLSITAVYVTHDQGEAMAMADRIVVMNRGRIEQIGAPREIYERPATRFVAGFIGQCGFLEGVCGDGGFVSRGGAGFQVTSSVAGPATLAIRPEAVVVGGGGANRFEAAVEDVVYLGDKASLTLVLDSGERLQSAARVSPGLPLPRTGERVGLAVAVEDCMVIEGVEG